VLTFLYEKLISFKVNLVVTSVNAENPLAVGIQSVEVAGPLLRALVVAGGPAALSTLARSSGMAPSKARKYLASLVRVGLVSQENAGGKYRLGSFALELGLAAMRQLEVLDVAQEALNALREELDTTVSLAIWTAGGPALVRWAQTPYMAHPIRLGTVFPLLTSAPGRVFLAYLDEGQTRELAAAELARAKGAATAGGLRNAGDVKRLATEVKRSGLCSMQSIVAPGVDVVSAPVFDHTNAIVAAIVVVGIHGQGLDLSAGGRFASRLAAACCSLSQRLGAHRVPA
jgi:DNA-binding IclR family transcriptional regulator